MSLTSNIISDILSIEQKRLVILASVEYSSTGTTRYCNLDKTSTSTITAYTFNNKDYTCIAMQFSGPGSTSNEGEMEAATLQISDVNGTIKNIYETEDITGIRVDIIRTFEGRTAATDIIDEFKWKYRVDQFVYNDNDFIATFKLRTLAQEANNEIPLLIRDQNRCGFTFDKDGTNELAKRTCGWFSKYRTNYSGATTSGQYTMASEYPGDDIDFPSAVAGTCDKGFRTANGCAAHFNQKDLTKPAMRGQFYPGMPVLNIQEIN